MANKEIKNVEYGLEKIFEGAKDFLPLLGTDYVEFQRQPGAVQKNAIRFSERPRTDYTSCLRTAGAGDQYVAQGAIGEGPDCTGARKARRTQLRLGRQRLGRTSVSRIFQTANQNKPPARSLSWHGAGDDRFDCRSGLSYDHRSAPATATSSQR